MKFFFHSGIDREYGDNISSLTVKRKIEQLIQAEDPKRPLSDSELMRILNRRRDPDRPPHRRQVPRRAQHPIVHRPQTDLLIPSRRGVSGRPRP